MNKKRFFSILLAAVMIVSSTSVVSAGEDGARQAKTSASATLSVGTSIEDLTVNYQKDPIGIDKDEIRFGWQMKSNVIGQEQKNYQIVVTKGHKDGEVVWNSGVVKSGLSTGISYDYNKGAGLLLETRYYWTVKVTDIFGNTHVSEPAYFETGTSFDGASWIYPQKPGTTTLTPANYAANAAFLSGNGWDVSSANWGTVMDELFGYRPNNPTWEGNNAVGNYVRMGGNSLIRTKATLNTGKTVESARLYMTGLGNYDPYVNGEKALLKGPMGEKIEPMFAPGAVDYNRYVNYQTYDVTEQVKKGNGEVVVGAEMSKGYYAGRVSSSAYNAIAGVPNSAGANRTLALIGKLVITYTDGSTQVVGTNADDWKSSRGAILFNDYFNGEIKDGNLAKNLKDWSKPSYDDAGWLIVSDANWNYSGRLEPGNEAVARWAEEMTQRPVSGFTFTTPVSRSSSESVTNRVGLTPAQLSAPITMTYNSTLAENKILALDFGQNISGTVQLTMTGDKDTIVRVRHAEVLNADITGTGNGGRDAQIGSLYYGAMRGADGQISYYKLTGETNEIWLPYTTYNGFQHVEISVVSGGSVTFNDIQAKVITSAYNRTSDFETNNAAINRMYENGYWGQVSNWMTIPTDCNQRSERVGWTGDAQIFAQAAIYNFDAVPFYENYIKIMNDHNRTYNGTYANVMPRGGYTNNTSLYCGWSDSGIVIPWTLYQQTGDINIIKNGYADMNRYMDAVYGNGPTGIANVTIGGQSTRRINMYDHTQYYGDWLAFKGAHLTFMDAVYQIYSTELMLKMAEAIDDTAMVAKYTARHAELKAVFMAPPTIVKVNSATQNRYEYQRIGGGFVYDAATAAQTNGYKNDAYAKLDLEDGDIASYGYNINSTYINNYMDNAQTALVWVLKLGLYRDEAHRQYLIKKLDECIKNEGNALRDEPEYSLGVGFLGVNVLLPMVTEAGLNDTSFKMLFQDQVPGWMAPVRNGATTWWERWDSFDSAKGFGASGMNSFNHFSYGCINEWFNEYVLGFQQVETAPGFKEFVLQPGIDTTGNLTYAKGSYDSYYGKIKSGWTAKATEITSYACTVPANTTATLYLPVDADNVRVRSSGAQYVGDDVKNGQDVAVFKLVSGSYDFMVEDGVVTANTAEGYVDTSFTLADPSKTEYKVNEPFDVLVTTLASATKVKIVNENGSTIGKLGETVANNEDGTKTYRITLMIGTKGDRTISAMVMGQIGDYKNVGADLGVTIVPATSLPAINDKIISASAPGISVVNTPFTVTVVTDKSITKVKIVSETGGAIGQLSSSVVAADGKKTWTIEIKVGSKGNRTFTALGSEATGGYGTEGKSFDIKIS